MNSQLERVAKIEINASTRVSGLVDAGRAWSAEIGAARADLERLDALLIDAAAKLLESFGAIAELSGGREEFARPLGQAATALQFQDLASQLIAHTSGRLAACARATSANTRATPADKPCQPVRQRDLEEGSIDLF